MHSKKDKIVPNIPENHASATAVPQQCASMAEESSYDWQDLQVTKPRRAVSVMLKILGFAQHSKML